MLDSPEPVKEAFVGDSLESVWHGAAPCPASWKRSMLDWFGPKVHEYYGSTEGAFISTIKADDWLEKGGSVGKPLETVEVLVVDDDGNRLTEPNASGTLYFRNLMGTDLNIIRLRKRRRKLILSPSIYNR